MQTQLIFPGDGEQLEIDFTESEERNGDCEQVFIYWN